MLGRGFLAAPGAFDKEPSSSGSDSESSSGTESIPDEGRIPKPGDQLAAMLVPRAELARFGDVFKFQEATFEANR